MTEPCGTPNKSANASNTPYGAEIPLTQAVKAAIGSESRFLSTPPAFDAPVRGVPVKILLCRLAWKNYSGVATRRLKKVEDMFIRFDMIHERVGHTHKQTPHDD